MKRNWTILRIFLAMMVITGSMVGTSAFAQGGTVVRVDPAVTAVQINNTFTLSVKVDNVSNLSAVELHLAYNPSILEVTQITNGGFVVADFVAQNIFNNAAGTIDYAIAQMNRPTAQGSGALLNITFHAKANGSSNLTLRATQASPSGLILSDANGVAILTSWSNGSVTVGTQVPSTATPSQPTATPVTPGPGTPTSTPVTPAPPTATPVPGLPTSTPVPSPSPNGAILGTHVVRLWESLYCIGRAYGVSPWAIASTNGIWWPYIIFPNQALLIPNIPWSPIPAGNICPAQFSTSSPILTPTPTAVPGVTATPISVTPAPTSAQTGCRYYYTVQRGDTLYNIAVRYGTSYAQVASANHLSNPRLIYVGQRLCIP